MIKKGFSPILILLIIVGILGGAVTGVYVNRFKIFEYRLRKAQKNLPQATSHESRVTRQELPKINLDSRFLASLELRRSGQIPDSKKRANTSNALGASTNSATNSLVALPPEINLAVPFTVQAPFAVWDELHEDGCEEASVLMVARFYKNQLITGPEDVDEEIYKIAAWEDASLGFNKDTSAALTAKILSQYYGFKNVSVKYDSDVTIEAIKKELANGRPVIVPNFGQALGNPFFKPPGPIYHMIVIKGYTRDGKFIVNDPGTKRGADFVYAQDTVMRSINDWDNENNRLSGGKAMIVIK